MRRASSKTYTIVFVRVTVLCERYAAVGVGCCWDGWRAWRMRIKDQVRSQAQRGVLLAPPPPPPSALSSYQHHSTATSTPLAHRLPPANVRPSAPLNRPSAIESHLPASLPSLTSHHGTHC